MARTQTQRAAAQETTQQPAQQQNGHVSLDEVIRHTLGDKRFQNRVENILPSDAGIAVPRFVALALATVLSDEKIMKCRMDTIEKAVLQAAQLGLEIGGARQHAAIVPFWDPKAGCFVATLIPMYRGKIYLAVKCGAVRDVRLRVVYEGDDFDYALGDDEHIRHVPRFRTRDHDKITHAYAIAVLPDGTMKCDIMSCEEIEYIRVTFSKQANGEMWTKSYPEACKKTVCHRVLKTVPIGEGVWAENFADALEIGGRAETGIVGGALSTETMEEIIARTAERLAAVQGASRTENVLQQVRGGLAAAGTETGGAATDEERAALRAEIDAREMSGEERANALAAAESADLTAAKVSEWRDWLEECPPARQREPGEDDAHVQPGLGV